MPEVRIPEVRIIAVGERPGRPPLIRLLVDVHAKNPTGEPCWVLIPTASPRSQPRGVDVLNELAIAPVTFGRLLGSDGCYAFALAPRASLTLRNLELDWWRSDDTKSPPPVDVRMSREVTLGGEPIAGWFQGEPVVTGDVEVDAGEARHVHTKRAEREVAVATTGGTSIRVEIQPNEPPRAVAPAGDRTTDVAEWRSGFPVPKGARRDSKRGGATTLAPGQNWVLEVWAVDAGIDVVAAFFTQHLPAAKRQVNGDAVQFTLPDGSVALVGDGATTRLEYRFGPQSAATRGYTFVDGNNNAWEITATAIRYVPVTPEQSSSGSYSGGVPKTVALAPGRFRYFEGLIQQVLVDTAHHLRDRPKGCGTIVAGDQRTFCRAGSPHLVELENELKAMLRP